MEQTFLDYTKVFLDDKKKILSTSTLMNYEYYIDKVLVPYFWKKRVSDISVEDVEIFKEKITKEFSNQGAKNIYSLLKQILDLAVMDGTIETNYTRLFKITRKNKTKNKNDMILTDLEIDRVCDYCKNNNLMMGIGVIICLKTGIRKGEVISLKLGDIDLKSENPCINIKSTVTRYKNEKDKDKISYKIGDTKTKFSKRLIPINNELKKLLEDYLEEYKKKFGLNDKELKQCFLIPNKNPKEFISPNKLDYYFRKLKKECKLNEDIHFHSLRHIFITKCIVDKNIPVNIVKYIVGHSTSTSITIDTYTHIDQDTINKYRNEI